MRTNDKSSLAGYQGVKHALRKLYAYLEEEKKMVLLALILAALGACFTIIGPNKVGDITEYMAASLRGKIDLTAIGRIGTFLVILFLLSSLCTFLQNLIMAKVTLWASEDLSQKISEKINKLPLSYFQKVPQGEILSRITNDVSTLQQGFSNSLAGLISSLAQFLGCLIMMLLTEWHLALAVILVTLFGLIGMGMVMMHSQKYFTKRQAAIGALNGYSEEIYSGRDVIRLSRAEKESVERFAEVNNEVYQANWRSQFLSGIMQPLMTVIGNVSYVAVAILGSYLALKGQIEFGIIVSFILYSRLFAAPLSQIAQRLTQLQMASAAATRVFDFLDAEELPKEENALTAMPEAIRGDVSFRHISFAYDEGAEPVIHDFSAEVHAGQKVAIVGPTGAGKTTLVKLLMRFYEPQKGEIRIDGVPVPSIQREVLHHLFGMVLQDTWLFEGSIRENLVYNLEGIPDTVLDRVCEACGLEEFIAGLPEGYDTVLSERVQVSQGQKQLLTIARAMVQNAPMMILDEATSSVDTRTESVIQKAMDHLTEGRTSFVIAHRLSTIRDADLILVLDQGDIVEQGNHETLLQKNGAYAKLYKSQFA